MNEEYLKGYFNTYVLPKKQDATYDDWVSKIKDNEQYKQGMFNTHVLPKKQDATYDDWNTKVFGSDLTGATASGKVVPKTETATTTTTTTPKTGYSENITNFVTLYQKDPKTAMQLLPTITEEEIKATPLNSMVKESIIKAKKNLELSNTFKEPILQAGVMRGVEVKAKQKEKDVPTLSFASIYKEAEKQKEDITIPYSSQEQTVTPLPKEDILKANLTLINSYLSKGDVDSYNTALKMTKIQAEKYPYLKSYANRLESYIKRKEGDFEGAAKSYDNIEDDSKTISDFNISAYSKVKAGKVEEANEDIDKAIERGNPSDINDIDDLIYSWQLKGNMAYNAGSTELMEQASSKIKELKYAKDRATKDNVFTIFTKTPLTQEEWDKQYNIVQKNFITSPILGAAEAAGMALQGVYEMSTPPPKDKVYTKEEYDKEKNDRVLLGYSKALNGMVSTAFNTFPSIYAFNIGMGAISEAEKEYRNKQLEDLQKYTNMPIEALERAKEEEGVTDTVSKWIFASLTTAIQTRGDYDSLSETQKNFLGLGDVIVTLLGLSLAHKGVSALKKNILPAIEDYIKAEDKFTTDKGVREFRERQAKVEATAEKIKNIDIDKATLDAIMEMKKEAEPIVAVMDKINKGEPITEAEGKLVVDFIDQTMKDPEFIIKTFKKEPVQVEKKVDNSVQGNLNRLRTEEANIVNKKEYAGIDDLYKAEEIGNEIGALNEKVNKVIAEKTKAVQEQIDLLKQERKDLYDKEGISNEELLVNSEIEADINTRLQPLLKEKQNIINEVYKLDITELDNILKPKEESKPITIDEQIAKTEDIINKEGVTETTPLVENEINKIDNSVISKEQPIVEVKPIRQLGTGANVYYESNKYRVNDFTDGNILLNVGAKDMEVPLANISFKDVNEAVFVAKKLQEIYPTGVPEAVLIDRVIDDFKKEYKVNKATEVKPTTPIEAGKKEVITTPIEEKLELNTNVKNVDIKDINTDIKRFQNREGEYSEQSVKNITENYDENKFDPIVSWKDTKDGKIYVLSGHSRLEALKRIGKEKIPTRIFEGTEAQAKQYAIDSNVLGTQETLMERANKYSKMREEGKTEVEIDKEANIEGANKQRVIDYSYLNKKGKTIASLKAFKESGVSENVDNIQKVAQWIGGARRIFKELTNAHENEMYDYLINKNKIGTKEGQISNKTQFFDLINKRINGLEEFKSNEPLNFEHRVGKGTLELEVSKEIKDLKAQQTKISADIKKAQKTIKDKELRDKTISNLTKEFLDVNKKIGDAEKKLEIAKEGDKKQISIFDELNKEVENGTITKETIERFEQRTENEVAKSESTIEALESKEKVATEKESIEKLESEVDKEITKVTEQQPTTPTTTPKVEVVKKSSTEIAKEIKPKDEFISKLNDTKESVKAKVKAFEEKYGLRAKGADGVSKAGLGLDDIIDAGFKAVELAYKAKKGVKEAIDKLITDVKDSDFYKALTKEQQKEFETDLLEHVKTIAHEVIKEQEKTTTENKKQTALEERTASSERAEEVRRLEEEFNEEVKNMTNEQYEKFKEFKELANTVPETKMIEEYATKGSIEFHQKETPEGPQEYFKMTFMKSLAHSVEAINKARELWGDNFVKKTLDYINTNHVPIQNKTLLYIGLENALRLEKINFPERAELITKQQNLVWEQSQRYAKTLGQGTAFQNLRAFAEANFEIEKATNEMFTSSELKSKKIIEQRISSNIKDIQKEYEETIETQELEGITDTKTTEVTEVTPAIREMIKKGVETEINKIYEKIPSERKQKIDTYINALSDIQTRLRSRTYEASIGIPVAIIDMGISAIKLALKGGVLLADAIEIGIAKIKELNNGKWEKEEQFRKDITEEFKNKKINVNEKIKTEKPKVEKVKKTAEEIAKEKLERKRASIEKLKEDINLKRNELKARDVPESDNIQYQILVKQQRALRQLIEKYIPKDEVLRSEKQTEVISKELLSDIDKINKEIIELEKSLKEKGEPIIDNEKVNNLKIAKKARLELINIVDPTKTDLVKNAMIDAGLTKDKVVKTKDGQKTIKVLDWEKLAGAEGSPELIRQRTEKYLTDKGYSKSDIIRVQDALENQYTALRDQIITKGYNKLESLNKVKMTSEQKIASRKLAEMYNYGLFDRQADTYNYLMNKLLGMNDLSQATFFKTKEIGKVLAELYDTKIFHQDKVDSSSLNHVLNIIDNNLRRLLRAELKNKKGVGAVNVRVARSVQALMELGQRMALNTVKQIIQNPLSGKIQLELVKLEGIFNKTDTKALKEKRKAIKYAILNDIITKGGQYYGKVTSQFLNKGMLDDYINKASDSRIYHMGMSVLLNRAGLEAADAYFKYQITDMYFIQNLLKILTDKTNPNRMSKRDALEFVSERLTGENFKTAESKAIELIKYANKNKPKNQKLIPENKETVLRLADDLVRESLLTGGKITLDQLKAAYEMAYKSAGFDLGHEANNLISRRVRYMSGNLEAAVNKSIKEGRMGEATMGIYTSILFRNIMNPFVGGGTNWTVLLAEKAALNPISLVTLIERNVRRRKLDVSDGASVRDMREALLRNRNAKSTNIRILAGNIAAVLTYIVAKGTGLDDNFEKWISKNEWLRKYVDLFTPEWLILYCHITEKEGLAKYLEKTFNSNPSYDKLDGIIKGLSDISSKGDGTKLGVALGQFFNAPTPWRLVRDIESIYRGATGKPQRARSPKPKGFVEGFFTYGMINYLKQKEGTYKEQAIIDEVEKKGALVGNEEAKRIDYIERANNRNIEIPKNATMEEAEQIVKTYNFDKRVENYNNKLKLYTKEELEKKGIYEPKETGKSGGSKSTKGKGKLSKSKKSKK